MTDIYPFRPFGTYQSFYPYYLPRFYVDYSPKSFQKYYYEPREVVSEIAVVKTPRANFVKYLVWVLLAFIAYKIAKRFM